MPSGKLILNVPYSILHVMQSLYIVSMEQFTCQFTVILAIKMGLNNLFSFRNDCEVAVTHGNNDTWLELTKVIN